MKFDHHAFISYAHIDNEPLTPGQKGWVAQFHATLQTMLSQRLGEKARIWRDDKLEGNDMFAQEIVASVPGRRCSLPPRRVVPRRSETKRPCSTRRQPAACPRSVRESNRRS